MLLCILGKLVCKKTTGFGLSVGFRFGDAFSPELKFGSSSALKFGFWFLLPRHSSQTEPNPLPSLGSSQFPRLRGISLEGFKRNPSTESRRGV